MSPVALTTIAIKHSRKSWRQCLINLAESFTSDFMTSTFSNTQMGYNGYTNYATWNAALWVLNEEFLYNTAKA
ncbi:MAG: hypothetical protein EB165_06275, partial [Euryarchaeota archaeon]|nr:hypothetical protein [Euryarchaeota archaeon]